MTDMFPEVGSSTSSLADFDPMSVAAPDPAVEAAAAAAKKKAAREKIAAEAKQKKAALMAKLEAQKAVEKAELEKLAQLGANAGVSLRKHSSRCF